MSTTTENRAVKATETYRALAARYEELEQTTAELCEDCGWSMRFPGEECANCERYRLRVRYEEAIEVLRKLRNEVGGIVEMARPCIGHTNAHVLRLRIEEADEALLRRHDASRTTGERSED